MATPSEKAAAFLAQIYKQLEKDIKKELEKSAREGFSKDLVRELRVAQARVRVLISNAEAASLPAAAALAGGAYQEGTDRVIQSLRKYLSPGQINSILSANDRAAAQVLAENAVAKFSEIGQLVGRRVDDILRRLALNEATLQVAAGEAVPSFASQLATALEQVGAASENAGISIIRVGGRNLQLDKYTEMVARTTLREAATTGAKNRLVENGLDLVYIDGGQEGICEICQPFAGNTYSISGNSSEYPVLGEEPPFHPNCRCVLSPAELF